MQKYIFLPVIIVISLFTAARAQVYEKKTVHAGESLSAVSSYLFPAFTTASVKLKNGGQLTSKMNFNLLICEMQFIDPHGDTLKVAKPADIDIISFDSTLFYYNDGYYQTFATPGSIKLSILRKVSYEPVKIGAMGLQNHSGTGIQSYTSFTSTSGDKQLVMNEDVDIIIETSYFLISADGQKVKANTAGFFKLFPQNKQRIQAYNKEKKINFNKKSDLIKLLDFCVELT